MPSGATAEPAYPGGLCWVISFLFSIPGPATLLRFHPSGHLVFWLLSSSLPSGLLLRNCFVCSPVGRAGGGVSFVSMFSTYSPPNQRALDVPTEFIPATQRHALRGDGGAGVPWRAWLGEFFPSFPPPAPPPCSASNRSATLAPRRHFFDPTLRCAFPKLFCFFTGRARRRRCRCCLDVFHLFAAESARPRSPHRVYSRHPTLALTGGEPLGRAVR